LTPAVFYDNLSKRTFFAISILFTRTALPSHTATILIVDDEDSVREVTAEMLRQTTGYVVLEASSGPEALTAFVKQRGRIDLLLTDLIMPGVTGRQLADALVAQYPGLEVIFMSGYVDETRSEAAVKGIHYIQKPLVMHKLVAMINDLLKPKMQHRSQ
jgi:two-component system cell cycle sensor histidine kinase/response regulator CckA